MIHLAQKVIDIVASVVGLLLLAPFCFFKAWEECDSTEGPYPVHKIDRWKWHALNAVYGNPEDGVSGRYALIWNDEGSARVLYKPDSGDRWRAYCWSAWRNTTDQLKWTFHE